MTESTGVVPFCQCLTLCPVTGRWEALGGGMLGRARQRTARVLPAAKQAKSTALRASPELRVGHILGYSKGFFSVSPAGNSEGLHSTDSMWIT